MTSGRVKIAGCITLERGATVCCIAVAGRIKKKRLSTDGHVLYTLRVAVERLKTGGCVVAAGGKAEEGLSALSGVFVGIAAVWWGNDSLRDGRKRKQANANSANAE